MDFVRLKAFMKYFEHHPPMHLMIAAYLGFGEKSDGDSGGEPVSDSAASILDELDPPTSAAEVVL